MELDKIRIRELRVRCRLGVTPEERRLPQEIIITVTLHADLARSCRTDDLRDTVDYAAMKKAILALCESRPFKLIERLAQCVSDVALAEPLVQRVEVVVQKPGALRYARCSEVQIARSRESGGGRQDGGGRRMQVAPGRTGFRKAGRPG